MTTMTMLPAPTSHDDQLVAHRVVVHVLVRWREDLLLVRRVAIDRWVVPSGGLGVGEPASAAACRILAAHVGLLAIPGKVWMAHAQHNRDGDGHGGAGGVELYFAVGGFRGLPVVDPSIYSRLGWWRPHILPDGLPEHLRTALALFGAPACTYTETGWASAGPRR